MRVSEHVALGRAQPSLDFVDAHVDTDTAILVDPNALRGLDTVWGAECRSLLQHFFAHVLSLIQHGYDDDAVALLDVLWLQDESLADSDNLPPPDVIAQEIVEDLGAALEQFRWIATDLAGEVPRA